MQVSVYTHSIINHNVGSMLVVSCFVLASDLCDSFHPKTFIIGQQNISHVKNAQLRSITYGMTSVTDHFCDVMQCQNNRYLHTDLFWTLDGDRTSNNIFILQNSYIHITKAAYLFCPVLFTSLCSIQTIDKTKQHDEESINCVTEG